MPSLSILLCHPLPHIVRYYDGTSVRDNVALLLVSYRQFFDLEGESGIVVRAIGTSVTLGKQLAPACISPQPPPSVSPNPE